MGVANEGLALCESGAFGTLEDIESKTAVCDTEVVCCIGAYAYP